MKLKNKKTGKIVELEGSIYFDSEDRTFEVDNIKTLNEEWEDYEENEYYYAITSIKADGNITKMKNIHNDMVTFDKSIGNYFKTKEEAEKAVEKLKAWKRLKDNGFKLKGWYNPKTMIKIEIDGGFSEDVSVCDVMDDLDIVFGGE